MPARHALRDYIHQFMIPATFPCYLGHLACRCLLMTALCRVIDVLRVCA